MMKYHCVPSHKKETNLTRQHPTHTNKINSPLKIGIFEQEIIIIESIAKELSTRSTPLRTVGSRIKRHEFHSYYGWKLESLPYNLRATQSQQHQKRWRATASSNNGQSPATIWLAPKNIRINS